MTEIDRKKINDAFLGKVTGGDAAEAAEYLKKLEEKYGTTDRDELNELATWEEKEMYVRWIFHFDDAPETDKLLNFPQ